MEDVNFIVNDILQYLLHSFISQLSQKLSVVIINNRTFQPVSSKCNKIIADKKEIRIRRKRYGNSRDLIESNLLTASIHKYIVQIYSQHVSETFEKETSSDLSTIPSEKMHRDIPSGFIASSQ